MGPSRGPLIVFLQEKTRSVRLRGFCLIRSPEAGLYTRLNGEVSLTCIQLPLTSGSSETSRGMHFSGPSVKESVLCLGHIPASWSEPPGLRDFICFLFFYIPIHTTMSHPLGVGYSSGVECNIYCLGGLCHVSKTLAVCIISWKHYRTSLLYNQGYIVEVLGQKLGLWTSSVYKTLLVKCRSMN